MDPLAPARRLDAEARGILADALAALVAGDGQRYGELVHGAMGLLTAARWAADAPEVGSQLLVEHGLELAEREAPTRRVRVAPPK